MFPVRTKCVQQLTARCQQTSVFQCARLLLRSLLFQQFRERSAPHDSTTLVLESIRSNHDTIADRMPTNWSADALRLSSGECGSNGVCCDGAASATLGGSHVISFEGLDCHINTKIELALWIWFVVAISFGGVNACKTFAIHFQRFRRINARRYVKRKPLRRLLGQGHLLALMWMILIIFPLATSLAANQLRFPGSQHIGIDPVPTGLFFAVDTSFLILGGTYDSDPAASPSWRNAQRGGSSFG